MPEDGNRSGPMSSEDLRLIPIGAVEEAPDRPRCSRIRLLPEYAEGLKGVGGFRSVWVLFWLDRMSEPDRRVLVAHPRGDKSRPVRGVFALRSPMRPNPIGLTRVRMLDVEPDGLIVEGLDALPGTPVVDLKPVTGDEEFGVRRTIAGRASVRRFEDREVPREVIERLARAGQRAPFTGQMYSFVVTTDPQRRRELSKIFGRLPVRAPAFMLICMDFRKLEKFIAYRGRRNRMGDLGMLFLGIQDAAYAGENIVLAAEEEGLGTCFLGAAPFQAAELSEIFRLPKRVYPLVGLVLGYPAERPQARPRIPLDCCLFWDEYRDLTPDQTAAAMEVMDAGLIREGYYAKLGAKIPLTGETEDLVGYDQYGWSEHVSRKYGEHGQNRTKSMEDQLRRQGIEL